MVLAALCWLFAFSAAPGAPEPPASAVRVQNLLLQSDDLGSTAWERAAGGSGTAPVVDPERSLAPDGSFTAHRVTFDCGPGVSAADWSRLIQYVPMTEGRPYRFRFMARGERGGEVILTRGLGGFQRHLLTAEWQLIERTGEGRADQRANFVSWWLRQGLGEQLAVPGRATVHLWHPQLAESGASSEYQATGTAAVTVESGVAPPPMLTAESAAGLFQGRLSARACGGSSARADLPLRSAIDVARRATSIGPAHRPSLETGLRVTELGATAGIADARSAKGEMLIALSRLDPADDAIRLARIESALAAADEGRIPVRALKSLLDPGNIPALGAPAAARLSRLLALSGQEDLSSSAAALEEALRLDPWCPGAARSLASTVRALPAGRERVVEALSRAVEANPRDIGAWTEMVSALLDGGAARGARRAAASALQVAQAERDPERQFAFACDLVFSQWASGDRASAIKTLRSAVIPCLGSVDGAEPAVSDRSVLAVAALLASDGDSSAIDVLLNAWRTPLESLASRPLAPADDRASSAAVLFRLASLQLLFATDWPWASAAADRASASGLLGHLGSSRLKGMHAWRSGRLQEAEEVLRMSRQGDPASCYAYSMVLLALGRGDEAEEELRQLVRDSYPSPLALLAVDRLAVSGADGRIGAQALTSPSPPAPLEAVLERALPDAIDRLVAGPSRALTVEVTSIPKPGCSLEPLPLSFRIRNVTPRPYAIGKGAPIDADAAVVARLVKKSDGSAVDIPPFAVRVGRRLRLEPGAELDVDVDLACSPVGNLLVHRPLEAHRLEVSLIVNPVGPPQHPTPGLLGLQVVVPPIDVPGVDVSEQWMREAVGLTRDCSTAGCLPRIALALHAAARSSRCSDGARAALFGALASRWGALPASARGWLVSVLPEEPGFLQSLPEAVRSDRASEVLLARLLFGDVGADDPVIETCSASGDSLLAGLAKVIPGSARPSDAVPDPIREGSGAGGG